MSKKNELKVNDYVRINKPGFSGEVYYVESIIDGKDNTIYVVAQKEGTYVQRMKMKVNEITKL